MTVRRQGRKEALLEVLTADQVRERMEWLAREYMDCSADEAYRRLDAGEFRGSILEVVMRSMKVLLP